MNLAELFRYKQPAALMGGPVFIGPRPVLVKVNNLNTYDSWDRLLARYMPKHIPGTPKPLVDRFAKLAGLGR